MSSGEQVLVYNTRERALSTDFNRAQAFAGRARAQLARGQYNDVRQNWYDLPGVSSPNVGTETPLAADVYSGLMVDPQTTSLLVTPGQLGCLFPDPGGTADDSPYMLLDDPGLQVAGVLTFTANGGGGPRVDLIECQPSLVTLETDSRDIFNPATGLFSPNNVPKVQVFRLQYRITLGTPSGGLPARSVGWLPLAVAVVGTTAVSFADCDFYDVRPLVEDRVHSQPAALATPNAGYHPIQSAEFSTRVSGGNTLIGGFAVSDFNGYVAGGELRRSSPYFTGGTRAGTGNLDGDPDFLNLSNPENHDTAFLFGHHFFVNICAAFPGFLPRWVRYSESAVSPFGRVPRGPRGILVASVLAPGLANGSSQLITTSVFANAPGVVLGVVNCNSAGTDFVPCNTQEKWTQTTDPPSNNNSVVASQVLTTQLISGQDYPTFAKAFRCTVFMTLHALIANNSGSIDVAVLDASGNVYAYLGQYITPVYGDTASHNYNLVLEVPNKGRATFDDIFGENSLTLRFTMQSSLVPLAVTLVLIHGWKLGS